MRRNGAHLDGYRSAQAWIVVGAGLFLLALLVSAVLDPELRVLHSLQALIYVAVIVLARRDSAWGYGAGFSIAVLWNLMSLFATHLIQAGAISLWMLLRTGHAGELIPMAVLLGGIGHFKQFLQSGEETATKDHIPVDGRS
ncbi:hypothetical protein [Acidisarcina polymorpha]|nr:hypothetical protein [Acidisarcina polymorpha]